MILLCLLLEFYFLLLSFVQTKHIHVQIYLLSVPPLGTPCGRSVETLVQSSNKYRVWNPFLLASAPFD